MNSLKSIKKEDSQEDYNSRFKMLMKLIRIDKMLRTATIINASAKNK